jgi:hypothetical protein
MRSGLVGQELWFFWSFWPAAQVVHADTAIKSVATIRKEEVLKRKFMAAPETLKKSLEQF